MDTFYPLCIYAVVPAWFLMILAPKSSYTFSVGKLTAIILSVLYVGVFLYTLLIAPVDAGSKELSTLSGLTWFLSFKSTVLATVLHRLIFDLWVGLWITSDINASSNFPYAMSFIVTTVTMVSGPMGLVLYLFWKHIVDSVAGKQSSPVAMLSEPVTWAGAGATTATMPDFSGPQRQPPPTSRPQPAGGRGGGGPMPPGVDDYYLYDHEEEDERRGAGGRGRGGRRLPPRHGHGGRGG